MTSARRPARQAGFTLVELVMVIIVTGVLAAIALPKFVDTTMWRLRAFSDDLVSQALAARRLALSQRRPVVATITPTGVGFAYASGGTIATIACPAAVPSCIGEAGSRTVTFNASNSGAATTSSGATLSITVTDGGSFSRIIQVETETGLVRPLS